MSDYATKMKRSRTADDVEDFMARCLKEYFLPGGRDHGEVLKYRMYMWITGQYDEATKDLVDLD